MNKNVAGVFVPDEIISEMEKVEKEKIRQRIVLLLGEIQLV